MASQEITDQLKSLGKIGYVLAIIISLGHIYYNSFDNLPPLLHNSLHFAGFALLCVLSYPLFGNKNRLIKTANLVLGILIAVSAVYLILMEDAIYDRGVRLNQMEWIAGIVLIIGAIELTRRTTGWIIPALIIIALSYVTFWGQWAGGVFKFSGLSTETVLFRSIYGDDGIFGNIASISSTFVFMFILFGAFLLCSGAGDFVINLAKALAGKIVGGPGLVAVIASGLTGTISGSAVANTASTGVITIPLMKKAGFGSKFAGGVEAAASTGGQLMPPIMGAGAFVMASYTQIPYTTIISVSVLPAFLYFFTVAFFVRGEAKRLGLAALDEEIPKFSEIMKQGGIAFIIPIALLIGLLIYGFTPTYAAGFSIISVVIASWLTPNKMGLKAICDALALGAKNMIMTAILLCSVGLIVNVIAMAGIGNTFSLMINDWAGGNLLIAIILIALASLVLGMGLPVTASYIVLATLSAPALYTMISDSMLVNVLISGEMTDTAKTMLALVNPEFLTGSVQLDAAGAKELLVGLPQELAQTVKDELVSAELITGALLSAHMIIFWLSQDSNVTPPVCLTAFTAAAIAKSPPMATGLQSWKIAKGLYLVPLLFAYTPFLYGTLVQQVTVFVAALIVIYLLVWTIQKILNKF